MEAIFYMAGLATMFCANALIMYVLAWFFTEVIALPWKVKPFNCRGCLSFWLTSICGVILSCVVAPRIPYADAGFLRINLSLIAVLFGFINYLYIKSKFQIYE